jgi:peptidoglycan hydrolase CwlO-like protein
MDQQAQEKIESLSAQVRKLQNELDRTAFDLKAYKAKFGRLDAQPAKRSK